MCACSRADDRTAAIQVVDNRLHLLGRKILKPESENEQVGRVHRIGMRHVAVARNDRAGLLVNVEQHRALESMMLGEDASQRGKRFFAAVFVVAGKEHDVLPCSGACATFIDERAVIRANRGNEADQQQYQQLRKRI